MKNKTCPMLRLTSLLLMAFLCIAWADDWEGIKAGSGKVTSVSAEFVQEKHMKILARPLISKGTFQFQPPGSLRWEYKSPVKSILLMHKGKTKQYIQGNKGIIEATGAHLESMRIVLKQITGVLSGSFSEDLFIATLKPGRNIVLTPKEKSMSRFIRRIEIALSDRPGLIESVSIYESENSFTKLMFINALLNQKISESLFKNQ
ncbi:MAG: outer membrane lipoprotein carrier protein LolA [Desulfobacterales bacterium]|nr:outer membrane lipoprotein carrier protein LolA [Desulfobacterales bacterium]